MHLSKWKWAFASAFLLLVFPCGRVFAQGSLPSGWSDGDIGSVGVTGSASYTSNVFTVKGSGAGMTGTADGMNLVYQTLSGDRKSTRLNSSHTVISYAVFCLKKKKQEYTHK